MKNLADLGALCGATNTIVWTSGDIYPGIQSEGGFPHLHALFPAHNGFLRFNSGATLSDILVASMAVELFHPRSCTCVQALVGLNFRHLY